MKREPENLIKKHLTREMENIVCRREFRKEKINLAVFQQSKNKIPKLLNKG